MIAAISSHSNTYKANVASISEALDLARDLRRGAWGGYGATVDRLSVFASDDEWSEDPPVATYSRIRGRWVRDAA